MIAYVVRRLLLLVPMAIGMVIVTFGLLLLVPGDPAATSVDRARLEAVLASDEGLDGSWLGLSNALLAGMVGLAVVVLFLADEVRHRLMTRR